MKVLKKVVWVIFCTLGLTCFTAVLWVFRNFNGIKMAEIIYTMTTSLEGVNEHMIRDAVIRIGLPPLLFMAALILIAVFVKRRGVYWLLGGACGLLMVFSLGYFSAETGLVPYLKSLNSDSTFIADYYTSPDTVRLTFPEKKRNLIVIYLESMEISFSDTGHGGGKSTDLIPGLTKLGIETGTFSPEAGRLNGGFDLYGTTYTMGGLFAMTAGLPLIPVNEVITLTEGFLPGIRTLGDILKDEGYQSYFCIGTDASFGERGLYFETHGGTRILDYSYAYEHKEIEEDYEREWWGFDDSIVYENAKKYLGGIAGNEEPFCFMMLTSDTHAEDGYVCEKCGNEYEDQYANVISCADRQVMEFLDWIRQQDFFENTTVVISGDHCSMDSDFGDDMPSDYERRVYTVFYNSAVKEQPVHEHYTTMDTFPTILASLGAEIEGNRLGMGVNLYSGEKSLAELYDRDYLDQELLMSGNSFFEDKLGAAIHHELTAAYDEAGQFYLLSAPDIDFDGRYDGGFFGIYNKDHSKVKNYLAAYNEETNAYEAAVTGFDLDDLLNPDAPETSLYFDFYLQLPDGLPFFYAASNLEIYAGDERSAA